MVFFIIYKNRVNKLQGTELNFATNCKDISNYVDLQGSKLGQGVMEWNSWPFENIHIWHSEYKN